MLNTLRLNPRLIKSFLHSNKHNIFASQLKSFSSQGPKNAQNKKLTSTLLYFSGIGVLTVGLSYAAVPLYRMFCSAYSYGGTTGVQHDGSKIESIGKSQRSRN